MTDATSVLIRFKGFDELEDEEDLRAGLRRRSEAIVAGFEELERVEVALSPNAGGVQASAHATGKGTNTASHAEAGDPRQAGERALHKLERELRREHDKRIFQRRREAQKSAGKRVS